MSDRPNGTAHAGIPNRRARTGWQGRRRGTTTTATSVTSETDGAIQPARPTASGERCEKASQISARILEGIGIAASEYARVLLDDSEAIWPRYLTHVREGAEGAERWPAVERGAVQKRLDEMADAVDGLSVVWFAVVDS